MGKWEGVGPWKWRVFWALWNSIKSIGECHYGPKNILTRGTVNLAGTLHSRVNMYRAVSLRIYKWYGGHWSGVICRVELVQLGFIYWRLRLCTVLSGQHSSAVLFLLVLYFQVQGLLLYLHGFLQDQIIAGTFSTLYPCCSISKSVLLWNHDKN